MKQLLSSLAIIGALVFLPVGSNSSSMDTRSDQILGKVSSTYKGFKTIKAAFSLKTNNSQNNSSNTEKGKLYLKGKMFRIELAGQEIYCDGKTIWTYLKDANEVQITDYDDANMDISPSSIFTIYEKGFMHRYVGDQSLAGVNYHKIELTPTDKGKPYFKVKMDINATNYQVKSVEVNMKNGISTVYSIDQFASNVALNDSFFVFDPARKPAGLVEVDLR